MAVSCKRAGRCPPCAAVHAALLPPGSYNKLNWRMVSKPGGATVKPDDYYRLYGLHMQVVCCTAGTRLTPG